MNARFTVLLLLPTGLCLGQTSVDVAGRLRAELRQKYSYSPLPPVETVEVKPLSEDEDIVQLEPFSVSAFNIFREDVGAAARREAEAKEAAKFSPLKGGLIFEKLIGPVDFKLGLWPILVPFAPEDPILKPGMKLRVDLIRIDW